jgi:hypothetical protein
VILWNTFAQQNHKSATYKLSSRAAACCYALLLPTRLLNYASALHIRETNQNRFNAELDGAAAKHDYFKPTRSLH